jgi:uncharacterized protein with PIN domain
VTEAIYKPTSRCPKCRRCPNVRFTAGEVARSKLERQAARVMSIACAHCGEQYWVRAHDIAEASLEQSEVPRDKRDTLDSRVMARIA